MPDSADEAPPLRPIADIIKGLSKPPPERLLQTKKMGGQTIHFIPWYRAQRILDHYTGSRWEYKILETDFYNRNCVVKVQITIQAAEGHYHYQGQGVAELREDGKGYGDPPQRAESQAFRRACARTGLMLDLYEGIDAYRQRRQKYEQRQRDSEGGQRQQNGQPQQQNGQRHNEAVKQQRDDLPF
jgi:hypothetical protein